MNGETLKYLERVKRFVEDWQPYNHTSTYASGEVDAVRAWALDTWPNVSVTHKAYGDEARITFTFPDNAHQS